MKYITAELGSLCASLHGPVAEVADVSTELFALPSVVDLPLHHRHDHLVLLELVPVPVLLSSQKSRTSFTMNEWFSRF